jgi:hypothetical protein
LIQHSGLGDSLKLDKSLLQISIKPPPPPPFPGEETSRCFSRGKVC